VYLKELVNLKHLQNKKENYTMKKYKIIGKYQNKRDMTVYRLVEEGSENTKPKEYVKNIKRQCMVGKEYIDEHNTDVFTFDNETVDTIELAPLNVYVSLAGYCEFDYIDDNGKNSAEQLHRTIAYSWFPNYDLTKHEVHHIDGSKLNNRLDNLLACTPFFNSYLEFKRGNSNAKKYLVKAIENDFKMRSYLDMVAAAKEIVESEKIYTFNEVTDNSKETINAMKYVLEKNGYTVTKNDDDDSSPVKV
jgi:hypothetical protein